MQNKKGLDAKKMFVVSVMPCTAKKFECTRAEMQNDGMKNVDAVITTRELGSMIKQLVLILKTCLMKNLMNQWDSQLVQLIYLD